MSDLATLAKKTTADLLDLLEVSTKEVAVEKGEENQLIVNIAVSEEDSGLLIGYHGENLNALQYILGQIVNHGREEWTKILVNVNNYRLQREAELRQMAKNAADRAIATGDEIEMPFLTPAERRIIHLELAERSDVTSFSEGEDRTRRLIISPKTKNSKSKIRISK